MKVTLKVNEYGAVEIIGSNGRALPGARLEVELPDLPKTLGQVAFEARIPNGHWSAIPTRDSWERAAQAVITEHEARKAQTATPDPDAEQLSTARGVAAGCSFDTIKAVAREAWRLGARP